ncbi:MAG TPA: hypothetical protein VKU90_12665 [Caulobacteraceae bacterium]|nr:hypothetical protein [Caulobacteraceae bacterium]
MTLRTLLMILFSVSLSGLAQVAFKAGVSAPGARAAFASQSPVAMLLAMSLSPAIVGGLALYGVGTAVWLAVLSRAPLSTAYPFVGLSFVITAGLGWWLFHEPIGPARLAGTALVVAGIVLVARG